MRIHTTQRAKRTRVVGPVWVATAPHTRPAPPSPGARQRRHAALELASSSSVWIKFRSSSGSRTRAVTRGSRSMSVSQTPATSRSANPLLRTREARSEAVAHTPLPTYIGVLPDWRSARREHARGALSGGENKLHITSYDTHTVRRFLHVLPRAHKGIRGAELRGAWEVSNQPCQPKLRDFDGSPRRYWLRSHYARKSPD